MLYSDVSFHRGEVKMFVRVDKSVIFLRLGKTWNGGHPEPNSGGHRDRDL